MARVRSSAQPDLFATVGDNSAAEAPPSDFIERIRGELRTTLARVCEASVLPWKDLTTATLAELRFNSITSWLPDDEAYALRISFQREMNRLYAIAEAE